MIRHAKILQVKFNFFANKSVNLKQKTIKIDNCVDVEEEDQAEDQAQDQAEGQAQDQAEGQVEDQAQDQAEGQHPKII